jgi:hypothetical protein
MSTPTKRTINLLNGDKWIVDYAACHGCTIQKHRCSLPEFLQPIYETKYVSVRQDDEWPVSGFYIISTKIHYESIGCMPENIASDIGKTVHRIRNAQEVCLGIHKVIIIQEERYIRSHFHAWLLPLYPDKLEKLPEDKGNINSGEIIDRHNIRIYRRVRTYNSNIISYLELFSAKTEMERILDSNNKMRLFLKNQHET